MPHWRADLSHPGEPDADSTILFVRRTLVWQARELRELREAQERIDAVAS